MLRENKILNAVAVLTVVAWFFSFARVVFGGFEGFREYVVTEIERIPRICVVETGITREEMLSRFARFGPAYMQIYYDKKYDSNITKYFYRIDIDDDETLFLMMVYSWKTGKIIDFDLVRGYQDWHFLSYGS